MAKTIKWVCVLVGLLCIMNSWTPRTSENRGVLAKDNEIKAVWVPTVFSIDYPSRAQTAAQPLKRDIEELVKNVSELGFNTIFFQVRPSADALYKSEIFPWSQYLSGTPGVAPEDGFDPLECLLAQAHAKGIKVHAWVNPYRVTASRGDIENQGNDSIYSKFPHLIVEHTDGKLYLNPGEPQANRLVIEGAVEIIKKYNVDGIHIDDYFYPGSDFPDGETFTRYGGKFSEIGDWRRNNTYSLVKGLHDAIEKERKDVVFSVSPCGIWANKKSHPDGSDTSGVQAYFDYYADTRAWVKDEIVDWIVPQIYWEIGNPAADFEKVARWWNDVVDGTTVKLCVGQAAYKAADETDVSSVWYAENGLSELSRQAKFLSALENVSGYAYYRLGSTLESNAIWEKTVGINNKTEKLFSDMEEYAWAEEAILALYDKGIVNGMGDGTFGCSRNITRADFTIMLTRIIGEKAEFDENFADVTKDKYYYNEIGMAKKLGYVSGTGDNLFHPETEISRQDMAVMAYRVLKEKNKIKKGSNIKLEEKFFDAHEIAEYAKEAMEEMVKGGFINGYETGEVMPKGNATRAEATVFLYKLTK